MDRWIVGSERCIRKLIAINSFILAAAAAAVGPLINPVLMECLA